MKRIALLLVVVFLAGCVTGDEIVSGPNWSDLAPKGRPRKFLEGIVSSERFEHGPVAVSPDMTELYWASHFPDGDPLSRILHVRMTEGGWTEPRVAEFAMPYSAGEPFFVDSDTLLFRSDRPLTTPGAKTRTYWTVERTASGWSDPAPLGRPFFGVSWQSSMARDGTVYFVVDENARSDDFGKDDLYRARPAERQLGEAEREYGEVEREYGEAVNLGPGINTPYHDWAPFIFPDESALLFASTRPGGRGASDLYICFKAEDGWTPPRNLGRPVNTLGNENWPSLSPDGRCLFFVRNRLGNGDVYWIDASFLEELRREELE